MPLNKQKGNMYSWVTHTWNPIKGCKHDCSYCYLKSIPRFNMTPRLCAKELKTNLGEGKTIFVGSAADMWGGWVPSEWIQRVLMRCRKYEGNGYLFQTKNPERFWTWGTMNNFPYFSRLAVTVESNRDTRWWSNAPLNTKRLEEIGLLRRMRPRDGATENETMISIEPIMDFDLLRFVHLLKKANPHMVSIGADSKQHGLPEPPAIKVAQLVNELQGFTNVALKDNLKRIMGKEYTRHYGQGATKDA